MAEETKEETIKPSTEPSTEVKPKEEKTPLQKLLATSDVLMKLLEYPLLIS